jgi:hypothetical protein
VSSNRKLKADPNGPIARESESVARSVIGTRAACVVRVLKHGKSKVFLLEVSGSPGLVVAKLAPSPTIRNEFRIHGLLERAPVRTLRAYGTAPSSVADRTWLFMEYADGASFDRSSSLHRGYAADWLSRIHVWSNENGPWPLGDRSVSYHRNVVDLARATLLSALEALPDGDGHRDSVRGLVDLTDDLIAQWDQIAGVLGQLPPVLVHSGFASKNVVIGYEDESPVVLAFDWEQGGWGSGVADISMVDTDTYISTVSPAWPQVDTSIIQRAALLGRVLWCLAPIPGERVNLVGQWPQRALAKIGYYHTWSEQALAELRELERTMAA